jgi:hypothetical protein
MQRARESAADIMRKKQAAGKSNKATLLPISPPRILTFMSRSRREESRGGSRRRRWEKIIRPSRRREINEKKLLPSDDRDDRQDTDDGHGSLVTTPRLVSRRLRHNINLFHFPAYKAKYPVFGA